MTAHKYRKALREKKMLYLRTELEKIMNESMNLNGIFSLNRDNNLKSFFST